MFDPNALAKLNEIPRIDLCSLPTPLRRARNLEALLGEKSPRIWIKRDDLTGLAHGGNKSRKLEYLMAPAVSEGYTVVLTEGNVQSNHARMTAAAAAMCGLRCVLVLDARGGVEMQGNLLLDHLLGAEVVLIEPGVPRHAAMLDLARELEATEEKPYVIRVGGSTPLGALGYVRAITEMIEQFAALDIDPVRIYSPTGSQGTLAGLVVGAAIAGRDGWIEGVAVEDDEATLSADAAPIATGAAGLLGFDRHFVARDFSIEDRFVGEGYGIATETGLEAIALARSEGIILEPTYTAKALAGLIGHIREGRFSAGDDVIYLYTGGSPSVFARATELLSAGIGRGDTAV
jgi:D-cysteine desulfhydrase family pyridoxal phosphate-dependent enzyme